MSAKWDKRFLDLAALVATWSRDPSTQCGAVITRGKFVVSVGFNGFPARCHDDAALYNAREVKLKRVLHAEVNAIFSAKQDLTGCTIYVHPFTPCSQCAASIIQVGIDHVITKSPTAELQARWGDSINESLSMFKEAGISYQELIL